MAPALLRFKEDEVGIILNLKRVWRGSARDAITLSEVFAEKLESFTKEGGTVVDYERLATSDEFKVGLNADIKPGA
eukprot:7214823-Pyramimonas_sp.AAC.1